MNLNINPELEVKFLTFSGGEEHVQIAEQSLKSSYTIDVPLYSSSAVMRLYVFLDALDEMARLQSKVVNLSLNIGYMPYARQDRYCAKGQSFALSSFIENLNFNIGKCGNLNIILEFQDLHSDVSNVLLDDAENINYIEKTQEEIFTESDELISMLNSVDILVSPDTGARAKTQQIREISGRDETHMFNLDLIEMGKTRDPETGWISEMFIDYISNRVIGFSHEIMVEPSTTKRDIALGKYLEGKTLLIPDDICDGGMTFILIAKKLRDYGVGKIILYVTHGIFSKGLRDFDGLVDEIYTYNNINDLQNDKLTTVKR